MRFQTLIVLAAVFALAVALLWPVKRPTRRPPPTNQAPTQVKVDDDDVPWVYSLVLDEEEETVQSSTSEEAAPSNEAGEGEGDAGGDGGGDGGGGD
jgi:hypothetical protein